MRTSGPFLPSGRRLASTGQMVPSAVVSEQIRIMRAASRVAARSAAVSSAAASCGGSAGSATKITSTSET